VAKQHKARQQIRLDIKSNAGGTGKTTLATHIAYAVGSKGYNVTIMEFDPQGSLKQFAGLEEPIPEKNIAHDLIKGVKKGWGLTQVWPERLSTVTAIQGGQPLGAKLKEIQFHPRGNFLLSSRLEENPLDADLIIFDNPASLEPLGLLTLAAATHILVPMQCEPKAADGAAALISWFYDQIGSLGLKQEPEFLGFVPSRVDNKVAAHRIYSTQLPEVLQTLEVPINCFPPIRDSNEFLNASSVGLPLHLYRPGHAAAKDFEPIAASIIRIIKGI
jgi:chromosome partitioning protein